MVECARGNAHAGLGVPWRAGRGQRGGRAGQGLWEVWAAGANWSRWVVVSGAWWRSGGWWLHLEASNQRACALVMPVREGEGKVRCELGLTAR
jgi:hypothetical protein